MTRLASLAVAALVAAAAATPASAQAAGGPAGAIAHFNQSLEGGDRIAFRQERARAPRPSVGFSTVRDIVNASADRQGDRILGAGTVASGDGHSPRAQAIFERLRLESREDD